jgi:hypothetical protein
MGGAALASNLHVAGQPLPSHWCCPIIIVQLPLSNCCPQIAAVVFINIVAVVGGSGIISVAIAVTVAVALFAITIVAIIVDVALLMLLHQHCCCCSPWRPI